MTKEYEEFLAYLEARESEREDHLIHYGVKGQKWGTRNWQNADGSYTEAGKHHYGWGYGRQNTGGTQNLNQQMAPRMRSSVSRRPSYARPVSQKQPVQQRNPRALSQAEIEARKARTRKILGIAAGVAVAAALSYAAYKGSTKLRDSMRSEVFKRFNSDPSSVHTLHSKYWDAADRAKYAATSSGEGE